jgi:hypothetical protein
MEAVAPLAIDERVIADGLAGLQPTRDVQTASSREEFTEAVDEDDPAQEASAPRVGGLPGGCRRLVRRRECRRSICGAEGERRHPRRRRAKRRGLSSFTSFLP